eukprot:gene32644-17658_t
MTFLAGGVRKRTAPKRYEPLSLDKKSHGPKKSAVEALQNARCVRMADDLLLCDFCPGLLLPCLGLSSASSGREQQDIICASRHDSKSTALR